MSEMIWMSAAELRAALESHEETIHAGAPRSPSNFHCFARVDDVIDLVWPELERLGLAVAEIRQTQQEYATRAADNDDDDSVAGASDHEAAAALAWALSRLAPPAVVPERPKEGSA